MIFYHIFVQASIALRHTKETNNERTKIQDLSLNLTVLTVSISNPKFNLHVLKSAGLL